MKTRMTAAVLLLTGLLSSSAFAIQQYLNLGFNFDGAGGSGFVAYYDSRQAGMGDKLGGCFNCNICHTGSTPSATNINNYATDWRTAWIALEPGRIPYENPDAAAVTAWQNIESKDDDGDGFTNIAEITAGSNPGDPTSTPSSPGCQNGGLLTQGSSNGGPAAYNPNALNTSCSKATLGSTSKKEDPKQAMQMVLLFMLPFFTLAWLKVRVKA